MSEDEARRLARELFELPAFYADDGREWLESAAAKLAPILAERDALRAENDVGRMQMHDMETGAREATERIAEMEAEVERLEQTLPPSRWHVTELDTRWQGLVQKWQEAKREAREAKARLDAILSGERHLVRDEGAMAAGHLEWIECVELPEGEK